MQFTNALFTYPFDQAWITLAIRFQFSSFRERTKFRTFIECLSGASIPFWPSSPKETFWIHPLQFLSRNSFLWLSLSFRLIPGIGQDTDSPSSGPLIWVTIFLRIPIRRDILTSPFLKKALRSLFNFETDLKTNFKNSGKGYFLYEWFWWKESTLAGFKRLMKLNSHQMRASYTPVDR